MVITIDNLKVYARHGVLEQERVVGNRFTVSISVEVPDGAGHDDDLSTTVNYADLCTTVHQVMATPSQLIEHVAHRLVNAIRDNYPLVSGGSVTVTKPRPPIAGFDADGVSVTLTWGT